MNAPLSREEYLQILLAPARQNPERSRALPAAAYRDPAETVAMESEKQRKKSKRKKDRPPKVLKKWR